MPKATIIIPAFNAAKYIEKTLDTVLAQTFGDFECLVVDDGSTDDTLAILNRCAGVDNRIKVFQVEHKVGPARPRNCGLMHAAGDFIFIFDADDLMHPNKLEISMVAFEKNPAADFLFTNYNSIDAKGDCLKANYLAEYNTLKKLLPNGWETEIAFIDSKNLYPALVKVNFIGTSSVGLRKSALSAADKFNEDLKNSDDRLFWLLFSQTHHGVFINKILHSYRILNDGVSKRSFIERGPSKIQALKLAMNACEDKKLIPLFKKQIANDYAWLAYAYRKENLFINAKKAAFSSLKIKLNFLAVKQLILALIN